MVSPSDAQNLALKELHLESFDVVAKNDNPSGFILEGNGHHVVLSYSRPVEYFRGLSLLKEHAKDATFRLEEHARFASDGVMLDCSRNGVMKVETVYRFLRKMAYMGLDRLLLYTEDTYTIDGYPYFGHGRGRYTKDELKSIDAYAASFGIEVVPCIQTLGHLGGILWWSVFEKIRDTETTLLPDSEETYRFIEEEIKTCRECFHSSHIHIGMDEAWMMGFGTHFIQHGYENPQTIFIRHLQKVMGICKRYSFEPMIWSDMVFRMSRGGDYYGDAPVQPTLAQGLPSEVGLVYWDYYHESEAVYERFIGEHQLFKNPLIFAGGSWRWTSFAPMITPSLRKSRYALDACLKKGVKDVLLTGWGDNGNECSFFTMLPAMALYAEYSYEGNDQNLDALLQATCNETLDRMELLDLPNMPDGNPDNLFGNPSKYLFYQDVIGGLFDKHTNPCYRAHYQDYARRLDQAAKESLENTILYQTMASLCRVLEDKADIGVRLRKAYKAQDAKGLLLMATSDLPRIAKSIRAFQRNLETEWMGEDKSEGFDILDGRIGWLLERISTAERRIKAYVKDPKNTIEELLEEPLYVDGRKDDGPTEIMTWNWWGRTVSANVIG